MNYYSLISSMSKSIGYDPDAQAFITAAAITDVTQKEAINQLVLDFKAYGIWSKMLAIYPFVGGTVATHKYNLKDARDLDAAFRLSFSGGWTHSSNGALPNGTTGYADTFLNPTTQSIGQNSNYFSVYHRTNNGSQSGCAIGVVNTSAEGMCLFVKHSDANTYYNANDFILTGSGNHVSNTSGLFSVSRIISGTKKLYRNTSTITSSTPSSSSVPNASILIGCRREGSGFTGNFSNREFSFSAIGSVGFSDTEVTNSYTAIQAFQTTLGRQV